MDLPPEKGAAELRRMSHDINNLAAVLQGHAEALTRDVDPAHPGRRHLDPLLDTLKRLENLCRSLGALVNGEDLALFLPASRSDAAPGALSGRETVLLVDDEPALRAVTGRFLGMNGYKVLEAGGLEEALDLDGRSPEGVDVLVTDLLMPGGNGSDLVRLLRERRPGLKVVYFSGHGADELRRQVGNDPASVFITKPFRPKDLLVLLRELLDARPAGGS